MWINGMFPLFAGTIKNNKKLRQWENALEKQIVFANMVNLSLELFEWHNLPDTCNPLYMEQALLFEGRFALVNDPEYGYLSLRANPHNVYNIYGEPDRVSVIGYNGYYREFQNYIEGGDNSKAQAVVCKDNWLAFPYYLDIVNSADRLANSMKGIDVARNGLKRPYFVEIEQSQRASIEKLFTDLSNNEPVIVESNSGLYDGIKVVPAPADPSILKALWEDYDKLSNQWRERIGIQSNAVSDKTERLLVDEINANNQVTDMNIDIRLESRKRFCERANELFGLEIDCTLKYPHEGEALPLEENPYVDKKTDEGVESNVL